MTERLQLIEAFLNRHGWGRDHAQPLAGDASFRRYWRLTDGTRRAVLMDAPPPHEDVRPFARLARHLRGLGFSAPEVFGEDHEAGLLLLEDLGDGTFSRLLDDGAEAEPIYALATDALIALHRVPSRRSVLTGLPAYGDAPLLDEAFLLTDWYMPAMLGCPTTETTRDDYAACWRDAFTVVHAQPRTLVLRDFHVDNLMRLEGRAGVAACGLLDFQDALAGPAAYDLMSLLEDARRDVDPALKAAMLARYRKALPVAADESFESAFTVLAAQRHAKVIGIFTRLSLRDGKPAYLSHIPRLWKLLEAALRHPELGAVSDWFERNLPSAHRGVPTGRSAAE